MTSQIPASIRETTRNAAVAKLQSLYSGQLPNSAAIEIADAAFDAAWPAIREHFAQLLLDANPDRDADFSAGVDWAADTIRNS
ncbi:hypothetical protein OG455_41565 [Kitasatospora sp. NBC_01287]|uniref:hypothetical protein n=1 Tax=Kitasatospora sp. NBC_01287 TaxID=2903573 RepID=UPI002257DA09|nr:hypothetical protein [Kitasatospora sp. NBC_01287]MCX4750973.1 hypothetical protein [Kitasatospora sp. NBC_01287]MCX4751776.1 hypothetical protein [Kitasatospora sp. NBC_01287]MCX4751932.1 hypothetical protein [Kitasatospora sp. NBC_01287]